MIEIVFLSFHDCGFNQCMDTSVPAKAVWRTIGAALTRRLAHKFLQEKNFKKRFLVQLHLTKNSDSNWAVNIKNVFVIFLEEQNVNFNFAGLLGVKSCRLRGKGVGTEYS